MANLVVAYAVDFQSNLLLGTAPASVVWPEGSGGLLSSFPGTGRTRSGFASGSASCKEMGLDESAGIELFAYRWIPDPEGSKSWRPAKSRCQSEDPGLVPWGVVRVGRLRLRLRRGRYCRRLPGGYLRHMREHVAFFLRRCQGLFGKPLLRWVFQDKASYIPFDFLSRGLVVGKVEVPMRRSGVDSVGRGTVGSASP